MLRNNLAWLIIYAATMAGVVAVMLNVRQQVLESMSTPEELAKWEEWRAKAREQAAGEGPVQRKVPKSDEPPTLVLMRDYFPVMLGAAVIFTSVFFLFAMFVIRGLMKPASTPNRAGLPS